MPEKLDPDSTPGAKLLRIFRKLMVNGRKYYQAELANEYNCSSQTISRIMAEIASVIGPSLRFGIENRRKWYQICAPNAKSLGLDFEEIRYLSVCRDLAAQTLPAQILERVDDTIFNLALKMAGNHELANMLNDQPVFTFFSKGRIDYSSKYKFIEDLLQAIESKCVCLICYKALGRESCKKHRFIPGRLISMNQAIYALGGMLRDDCKTINNFSNLAVHRMNDVIRTDIKCEVEFPDISSGLFGLPWHEPRNFCVYFKAGKAAEYVAERIWSDKQKIVEQDDGSILLYITTSSEPEL